MTKKQKWLFIGIVAVLGLLYAAIKLEVVQLVGAKLQDAMADTITIRYDDSIVGDGSAVVSPDAEQMAFCRGSQEFFVQELRSGKITTYPTKDKVYQVKYSPDGGYLVAGRNVLSRKTEQITQLPTDALIIPHLNDNMAFSPDGESLALFNEQPGMNPRPDTIEIWNLRTQQLVQTLPVQGTHEMSFSRDGRYLAVAGWTITIWDIQTGKCVKTLVTKSKSADKSVKHDTDYETITYSPDGKYLATGVVSVYIKQRSGPGIQENFIEIWDVERGEVVKTLERDHCITTKLRYSPDGRYLAAGRTVGRDDNVRDVVWIWDVANWQVAKKLVRFPDYHIKAMDYSADGGWLSVSGSWRVKMWKMQ